MARKVVVPDYIVLSWRTDSEGRALSPRVWVCATSEDAKVAADGLRREGFRVKCVSAMGGK